MFDLVCNTSPIQYLHQIGLLNILAEISGRVVIPPAVLDEIDAGRKAGVNLPDLKEIPWITIQRPASEAAVSLVTDLGLGETQVLMLAIESRELVAILDDAVARRFAQSLGIPYTGTLGLLLDAKRAGLIEKITPYLEQLQSLGFRLAPETRTAVLRLAEEIE